MKALVQQKQSYSVSREVMDLLSPRISAGNSQSNSNYNGSNKSSASNRISNLATSSSFNNKNRNYRGSHNQRIKNDNSNSNGSLYTSVPLPPIIPTYPKTIKKNIQNLKHGLGSQNSSATNLDKKDKKLIAVKPARKWIWSPFASSARTDGSLFYHWVRAGIEYPDYPYARFDIHMDSISYTDEEYDLHLKHIDPTWTKTDTDRLFDLVRIYELRWPIIHDRWLSQTSDTATNRPVHHLQFRYYNTTTILNKIRLQKAATVHATASTTVGTHPYSTATSILSSSNATSTTTTTTLPNSTISTNDVAHNHTLQHAQKVKQVANAIVDQQTPINTIATGTSTMEPFQLEHETERRNQLELLWNRSKKEEHEEMALRKELKVIEAQMRKLKKSGSHFLRKGSAKAATISNISGGNVNNQMNAMDASQSSNVNYYSGNDATTNKPLPNINFDQAFAATAPIPTPGMPYLQSARLATPATGGHMGLNKSLIQKMDATLKELKVSERPSCPTKRVCDLFDSVRKHALIVLSLEKITVKKEHDLILKRKRLEQIRTNVELHGTPGKTTSSMLSVSSSMKKSILFPGTPQQQQQQQLHSQQQHHHHMKPSVMNSSGIKRNTAMPINNDNTNNAISAPTANASNTSFARSKSTGSTKSKRRNQTNSKSQKNNSIHNHNSGTNPLDAQNHSTIPNNSALYTSTGETTIPATTVITKKTTKRKPKKANANTAAMAAAAVVNSSNFASHSARTNQTIRYIQSTVPKSSNKAMSSSNNISNTVTSTLSSARGQILSSKSSSKKSIVNNSADLNLATASGTGPLTSHSMLAPPPPSSLLTNASSSILNAVGGVATSMMNPSNPTLTGTSNTSATHPIGFMMPGNVSNAGIRTTSSSSTLPLKSGNGPNVIMTKMGGQIMNNSKIVDGVVASNNSHDIVGTSQEDGKPSKKRARKS